MTMSPDSGVPLRAAILIVSTTAARDPSTDAAEQVLRSVLDQQNRQWAVPDTKIVPDSTSQIQRQITQWADAEDPPALIITTGGTGFAESDTTPEAVSSLLHKQASGLVHAMLTASLVVTPFATMSRPVAGVRFQSVILTLPGSPKGARENLEAVVRMLPHACLQAAGLKPSRELHKGGVARLEREAGVKAFEGLYGHGHSHGHSHGGHSRGNLIRHTKPADKPQSNNPILGPSRRYRESPYPMLSVDEALDLIKQHTPAPIPIISPVNSQLIGSVLAEDVYAREDVPGFRASLVDGYAVVVPPGGNMKGVFPVVYVSHAASGDTVAPLQEGQIARITTGAPLPPGATSVVMVEDTILRSRTEDGKEEKDVEILADDIVEGENIREIGSDVRKGTKILSKGARVSAVGGEIGLLASVDVAQVQTYRRPVVAVLSTGDELVSLDAYGSTQQTNLRLGQVRDTNRPTLVSAARDWGFETLDLGIAPDQPDALETALRDGLRRADVVITTGGVSMGELDLLKPTVERALGGIIRFGRVAMKPGKPTTFATVPSVKDAETGQRRVVGSGDRLLFALPGNPASAMVTFHLFVLPALHGIAGVSPPGLPRVTASLAHEFSLDTARAEYHRAIITVTKDGLLSAASTGGQRSSQVSSLRNANALLCLPKGAAPLPTGTKVDALLMNSVRTGP